MPMKLLRVILEKISRVMTTSNTQTTPCGLVKPFGDNLDIAWQYNSLKDINNKRIVTCDFCLKTTTGGITRAKRHQIGLKGDVGPCKKIPSDIKKILKDAYEKKMVEKESSMAEIDEDDDVQEEMQSIHNLKAGKRPASDGDLYTNKKGKNVKGPVDLLLFRKPESTQSSINLGKKNKKQSSINDACDKEARARTIQYIERFLCTNGIPFNVVRSRSFKLMVEEIGNYGPHLKPPSFYECRVPLLQKELEYTKELLKDHEVERTNFGCSIMSDGWTDRKNRTLINFLVNCPSGSMFVKSVDASEYVKTGNKLFELLDNFIQEIGERNIVQVVTDNGSNYVLAGKILEATRPHIFWTPCAAHCLDLILEDIGKLAKVKRTIQRGISLVGFIYNYSLALNTMRKFTSKTELVRHGVTGFATTFLTLQRLHKQKNNLRIKFTSDDWLKSKTAKDPKGKRPAGTVLMPAFWNDVVYCLKAMGPLVRVLRLVDNEKRPTMGYIYEAMDMAKEAIQKSFNGLEERYKDIFDIIDRRWECQLHHPLHAAGHFLNPEFFYANPRMDLDPEVMDGLVKVIERLSENSQEADMAMNEVYKYKRAEGSFGVQAAIRQRNTVAPTQWWSTYGARTPHLQKIAIKVLSLTCSSSGCELNWSTFELIHSKRRSRLEHQKLQDLVFIKYNQALKEHFDNRDLIDPIILNDIDDSNEWLLGDIGGDEEEQAGNELVFENDTLTWGEVGAASGANQPLQYTRRQSRLHNQPIQVPPNSRGQGKRMAIIEEEEEDDEESDNEENEVEKEEIYNLETSESEDEDLEINDCNSD